MAPEPFFGLYISKMKRLDCRSSPLQSWSSLVKSFSNYKTGLPNTKTSYDSGICIYYRDLQERENEVGIPMVNAHRQ